MEPRNEKTTVLNGVLNRVLPLNEKFWWSNEPEPQICEYARASFQIAQNMVLEYTIWKQKL